MRYRKINNFRDLNYIKSSNNIRIKKGLIFRSAFLYNISPKSIKKINNLKLDKIIDLRSEGEIKSYPDSIFDTKNIMATFDDPTYIVPCDNIDRTDINLYVKNKRCDESIKDREIAFYSTIYSKKLKNNDGIKEIIKSLNNHESFLFHCRGGKDRTGVSSLIILAALGFNKKEIIKDYLKTNNHFFVFLVRYGLRLLGFNKNGIKVVEVNLFAIKELADSSFDFIETNYLTIENFLKEEYQVTSEDIKSWKEYYLE